MLAPICVAVTILLTVYGQMVIKWQLGKLTLPEDHAGKVVFLVSQLLNPWVLTGFGSAFLASLCWMAAMTRIKLSDAYPFTSLSLVLVMLLTHIFFDEPLNQAKVLGTKLIVAGLVIISRSALDPKKYG